MASLECSRRLKDLQKQLLLTESHGKSGFCTKSVPDANPLRVVATLLNEENALDNQIATIAAEYEDERRLMRQAAELNAEVERLNDRVTKAREELQAAQTQAGELSAMHREDYSSTMTEVIQLDRESQQLESLLEKERMETEALKFELSEYDKQMLVD